MYSTMKGHKGKIGTLNKGHIIVPITDQNSKLEIYQSTCSHCHVH